MMCNKVTMPSRDINTAQAIECMDKERNALCIFIYGEIELTFYGDKFLRQRLFFENWQKKYLIIKHTI